MSRRRITETELPTGLAPSSKDASRKHIRCAIYTRKSSEKGLEQEFNSLDAQREGAQSFIVSQQAEGWICLPETYDGGSMERQTLERLLRNVEAGKIDCVVVYKLDRLSRSLLDFARIMETFERKGVSFVSVTQQFNTTSSMWRLTLNLLLSFALSLNARSLENASATNLVHCVARASGRVVRRSLGTTWIAPAEVPNSW